MEIIKMGTEILLMKIDPRAGNAFRAHKEGDCGYDLEVWLPNSDSVTLEPFSFVNLPTGLRVKMGDNSWGMVRARSSTLYTRQLIVAEGTIDSGYTGPLFVLVYNPTPGPKTITNGERLAQLVPIPKFEGVYVKNVMEMPNTARGTSGFGSTGGIRTNG